MCIRDSFYRGAQLDTWFIAAAAINGNTTATAVPEDAAASGPGGVRTAHAACVEEPRSRGDRRIDGRTRSQARAIGQQQLSPLPEDAASTPLPQPSSSDDRNQGLLSFAGKDVLLSVLATHNVVDGEREMRGVSEPGEPGDGGEQLAWPAGCLLYTSPSPRDS